jgi:quercetin 2,3-dioxygenase
LYVFVIDGKLSVNGKEMEPRDGMGIIGVSEIELMSSENTTVLLMEVSMN